MHGDSSAAEANRDVSPAQPRAVAPVVAVPEQRDEEQREHHPEHIRDPHEQRGEERGAGAGQGGDAGQDRSAARTRDPREGAERENGAGSAFLAGSHPEAGHRQAATGEREATRTNISAAPAR